MFAQLDWKVQKIVIVVVSVSLIGAGSLSVRLFRAEPAAFESVESSAPLEQADATEPSREIAVHVDGAVAHPDIYYLKEGARVADALERAGVLESADLFGVNLARVLADGQKVHVPVVGEARDSGLIDLNRAGFAELTSLPGIGKVTAERIIRYREEVAPFYVLEDLLRIEGFGDKKLDAIRDLVCVY